MTLIEAIARMEGWGIPGDLPTRKNNPGDICAGAFSAAHGATPSAGRFATFPTPAAGFAALRALLSTHYVGLTIAQAIERYAPASENNTARYVALVCEWTGTTPQTVVTPELIG